MISPPLATPAPTPRVASRAPRRRVVARASPRPQGGLTKTRCDACQGAGTQPCPTCNDIGATGWTIDGNTQRCDRKGYVPVTTGGWLGIGAKKTGERACERCNAGTKKTPGRIRCARCLGNKFLLFRSADWR